MSSLSSSLNQKTATSHESFEHNHVRVCGDGNEYVILGNKKYYRHELMSAFGGMLMPDRIAPFPARAHEFGNASALGLCAFSLTTFTLGLYYAGAMGVKVPNVVIGLTYFYGGVVQLLAGVWELIIGNTFAATAFGSYGPFWFGFACIFVDSFGISKAYANAPEQLNNAIGFYLIGWSIFTFMMLLCTLKSTVAFVGLFLTLDLTFILLAAANMTGNPHLTKAGGIMAVISASFGWYNGFAGIATKQNSYGFPSVIPLPVYGVKN